MDNPTFEKDGFLETPETYAQAIAAQELSSAKRVEIETNLALIAGDDTAFAASVRELSEQPEIADILELKELIGKYLTGWIDRNDFETSFNATFEDHMQERRKKLYEDQMLQMFLEVTPDEYKIIRDSNPEVYPGMDLTTQYVEVCRSEDGKLATSLVLKRKTWPDGTPRIMRQDLNPLEKQVYYRFIGLMAYHDDGEVNLEMTAALHEALADRRLQRRLAKGTPARIAPTNPVGRNELCPCGSMKKYKKCHLPNGNLVRGISLEEAQRVYGKDIFDYQAPPQEIEPSQQENATNEIEGELVASAVPVS